jgi:uncharacterized protein YbjQ (UPF0145 family)
MTDLEQLWRAKSDEEVMEAGAGLDEYTLEGQGVIRAELLRRGLRPAQRWECSKCHERIDDSFDSCWKCGASRQRVEPRFDLPQPTFMEGGRGLAASAGSSGSGAPDVPEGMLLVTTPSLESHTISQYLGVVFGEAILGADIFSDFLAGVTDIVGGRSSAYESALADARQMALSDMAHRANEAGANAVVSIDVKYETVRGTMLMVTCCGTAVKVS